MRAALADTYRVEPSTPRSLRALLRSAAWSALLATRDRCALRMTSHAGWPPDQHLVMDKGPAGRRHTCSRAGPACTTTCSAATATTRSTAATPATSSGATTTRPAGRRFQTAVIHAGNGPNFIYANDTAQLRLDRHQPGTPSCTRTRTRGVIHCENPNIVVFTSHHALPHYEARGLPAHQLLLGRLLSGCRRACPTPQACGPRDAQMLTERMPASS